MRIEIKESKSGVMPESFACCHCGKPVDLSQKGVVLIELRHDLCVLCAECHQKYDVQLNDVNYDGEAMSFGLVPKGLMGRY